MARRTTQRLIRRFDAVSRLHLPTFISGMPGRVAASFETFGGIVAMLVVTAKYAVLDVVTGEFSWKEFFAQAWFITTVTLVPTFLVAIPFGVTISIQVGTLAQQVGATSFMGAVTGIASIREAAPLVTALLLSGAAGSAICADLGARSIRDEVDALKVMGLSPIRLLVVPRVTACVAVGVFLVGVVAFTAITTGYFFNVFAQHGTSGSYIESFSSFAQGPDLILALVKAALFSFIAATIASYKGLEATGGPKGVGQAVNASVVLTVVLLFVANLAITQVYAIYVPQRALS